MDNVQPAKTQQGAPVKKIDLAALRKEGSRKPNQGSRKPFKKNFRKGGQKPQSKKPRTMDELDRELENYHLKGGNKEVGK